MHTATLNIHIQEFYMNIVFISLRLMQLCPLSEGHGLQACSYSLLMCCSVLSTESFIEESFAF